mgnify:CR=1 FL=1
MLVKQHAAELAPHGIRVNGVAPAPEPETPNVEQLEARVADIPLRADNSRGAGAPVLVIGTGEARVADDESLQVGWYSLDDLPPMPEHQAERLRAALEFTGRTGFEC